MTDYGTPEVRLCATLCWLASPWESTPDPDDYGVGDYLPLEQGAVIDVQSEPILYRVEGDELVSCTGDRLPLSRARSGWRYPDPELCLEWWVDRLESVGARADGRAA